KRISRRLKSVPTSLRAMTRVESASTHRMTAHFRLMARRLLLLIGDLKCAGACFAKHAPAHFKSPMSSSNLRAMRRKCAVILWVLALSTLVIALKDVGTLFNRREIL